MSDIPNLFSRDIEALAEKLFVQVADTSEDSCQADEYNLDIIRNCFRVAEQFIKYRNSR